MIWAIIIKFDQIRKNWWRISCAEILEVGKNLFAASSVKKMSRFADSPDEIKRIAWKFTKTVILLGLAGYEPTASLVIYISSYPARPRRINRELKQTRRRRRRERHLRISTIIFQLLKVILLERCVLAILELNWNQHLGNKTTTIEHLSSYAHVVHTPAKQVISRRRKNENVFKMSNDEKCMCKACRNTVFHCQICKFVEFLLPWLLKLPNDGRRTNWVKFHWAIERDTPCCENW